MDHFRYIYSSRADDYHRMITAEDIDGNLLAALKKITPLRGKRILDLGTGTGRLPLLFSSLTSQLVGFDLYRAMLHQNQIQRARAGGSWTLVQGEMQFLPFSTGWAEVTTAGWAIGHFRNWYASTWQDEIGRVLREMHRVTGNGGFLIILETLGTGSLNPAPPVEELGEYYAWLENQWGFSRQEIQTDYQFTSVEKAVEQTEFFFGLDLSTRIRENGWSRLPEWTGIWVKQV